MAHNDDHDDDGDADDDDDEDADSAGSYVTQNVFLINVKSCYTRVLLYVL